MSNLETVESLQVNSKLTKLFVVKPVYDKLSFQATPMGMLMLPNSKAAKIVLTKRIQIRKALRNTFAENVNVLDSKNIAHTKVHKAVNALMKILKAKSSFEIEAWSMSCYGELSPPVILIGALCCEVMVKDSRGWFPYRFGCSNNEQGLSLVDNFVNHRVEFEIPNVVS